MRSMPAGDAAADRRRRRRAPAPRRRPRPARASWPRCSATSSTSAWLTRLDLPEPDTPVTVVNTPSGKATSRLVQVVARDAAQAQPAAAARAASRGARRVLAEQVAPRLRRLDAREPFGRAAVEHLGRRARPPPGPTSTIQSAWRITSSSCSTTNSELPEAFSRSSAAAAPRCRPGCRPADGSSST